MQRLPYRFCFKLSSICCMIKKIVSIIFKQNPTYELISYPRLKLGNLDSRMNNFMLCNIVQIMCFMVLSEMWRIYSMNYVWFSQPTPLTLWTTTTISSSTHHVGQSLYPMLMNHKPILVCSEIKVYNKIQTCCSNNELLAPTFLVLRSNWTLVKWSWFAFEV